MSMNELANMHMMLNYMRGTYKVLEEELQTAAKALGLTQAEQHILWIVSFEKDVTISRIAKIGLWDVSTVMQVIKRLKDKQLVQVVKKSDDRRISYVMLTEEGKKKRKESEQLDLKIYRFFKKWLEDETKKEFIAELIELHREINQHFHGREYVKWIESTTKNIAE
ncbi:MarR family transcriptional regulator [Fictibacillus sp. Mic-4]|uniref:MarR family winged helix-turn-helix transcriptional regulator n=1 Tax=Fictibacillus TaxID=1329200 RepID=UPI0003FC7CF0|nr:MarR family transcriptional regulator [Fictibacillus gelatini]